ncbi:hypothetical protein LJB90_02960 [Eubacteriales bacterium OttesenSCG-928-G02]|nr:hypothetical protein [Eubacteriales bacterium OttesenSCG-928-G02]
MKDFKLLLKVSMLENFNINVFLKTKDEQLKKKYRRQMLLFVFAFVLMVGYSITYSNLMMQSFKLVQAEYLLLSSFMAISSILTLITTINKSSTGLFAFKDYDMISAMPIKSNIIILSRIANLYIFSLLYDMVILVPAGVIYAINVNPPFAFYPVFIITFLLIPIIPMIVGAFIGLIISIISSFFKKNNFVNIILSLAIFFAVYYMSFISTSSDSNLTNVISPIINKFNSIYPLVGLYTDSLVKFDILSIVLFIGITIVLGLIFVLITSVYYKKINTVLTTRRTQSNYKIVKTKHSSPRATLIKKEMKRFFGSALYLLNSGMGLILFIIATLFLAFSGTDKISEMLKIPDFNKYITSLLPFIFCMLAGMSNTTAPSISLEGSNFWILKTIPVNTMDILMSKALVNITLSGGVTLLCGTILIFSLKLFTFNSIFIYLLPLLFIILMSFIGLILNLNNVNLTWKNEITVIKQSMPVFLSLLIGMILPITLLAFTFYVGSYHTLILSIISLIFFIGIIIAYRYLKTKGIEKFNQIS